MGYLSSPEWSTTTPVRIHRSGGQEVVPVVKAVKLLMAVGLFASLFQVPVHADEAAVTRLPVEAIIEVVRLDYPAATQVSAASTDESMFSDVAPSIVDSDAEVFALGLRQADASPTETIGMILRLGDDVVVAQRVPNTNTFRVTQMSNGGSVQSSIVTAPPASVAAAAPAWCGEVEAALVAASVICWVGGITAAVCGGPSTLAGVSVFLICNTNLTWSITLHQNHFGGTKCYYTTVPGSYYGTGAGCELHYTAERGPVSVVHYTNNQSTPYKVQSWLRFHRDSAGLDVGSGIFDTPRFGIRTVVDGTMHSITSSSDLKVGTSVRPRYGKHRMILDYIDGSWVESNDVIPVD